MRGGHEPFHPSIRPASGCGLEEWWWSPQVKQEASTESELLPVMACLPGYLVVFFPSPHFFNESLNGEAHYVHYSISRETNSFLRPVRAPSSPPLEGSHCSAAVCLYSGSHLATWLLIIASLCIFIVQNKRIAESPALTTSPYTADDELDSNAARMWMNIAWDWDASGSSL